MSRILAKKSGIQVRRQAPWLNKRALSAPRSNKIVVNLANRAVSAMLGGWKWGLSAQGIEHSKRPDIWRDRTLQRAFELMGGIPAIQLQSTQSSISPQILAELAHLVALPAVTRAA